MKDLKIYLIIASVLLTIYIVARVNRPKAVDWSETLISKDKIPFGTFILFNRLQDIFPGAQVRPFRHAVYNVIAEDSIRQSSYVIVCPGFELSKTDYGQLEKYVKAGNDVFIASDYFGKLFEKNLNIRTEVSLNKPIYFLSPLLNPKKHYFIDNECGNAFFNKFDTLRAVVLGENTDHKANFIKYNLGKGSLYLLANPKLFSNYSLLKPQGAEYAATALSYVKNTKQLIWDEYYSQGSSDADTPMRIFLNNPTLQWAYFIAIFSLLIFVLFEIKRTQRVIPVIKPLSNSTLDFVTVVGQVYYEKHDNANIAQKKILYLLTYLREVYQIKTNNPDDEFIEKITSKLGIEADFARQVADYIAYISAKERITDNELIKLNKLIEKLYIQAR